MSLPFKPHIAKLPAYRPPSVPPGVERVVDLFSNENPWDRRLKRWLLCKWPRAW